MRRTLAVLGLWMAFSASLGAWEKDFAVNPSAEADRNRDGMPDGWRAAAYHSPAQHAWDKDVAHSGKAGLRIRDSIRPGEKAWNQNVGRWTSATKRPVIAG